MRTEAYGSLWGAKTSPGEVGGAGFFWGALLLKLLLSFLLAAATFFLPHPWEATPGGGLMQPPCMEGAGHAPSPPRP